MSQVELSRSRRIRELLDGLVMIFRLCAYDALSVILIEKARFEVMVWLTEKFVRRLPLSR